MIGKTKPLTPAEKNDVLESILNAGRQMNLLYEQIEAGTITHLAAARAFESLATGMTQLSQGYRRKLLSGGTVLKP
jgi:hypothetical protein